jgi:hypothetical protein
VRQEVRSKTARGLKKKRNSPQSPQTFDLQANHTFPAACVTTWKATTWKAHYFFLKKTKLPLLFKKTVFLIWDILGAQLEDWMVGELIRAYLLGLERIEGIRLTRS